MKERTLRTASRNSVYLIAGQVSGQILSLLFVVLAARSLGVESFGCYVTAAALASWLTIASGFGFDLLVIRQLSRDPVRSSELFATTLLVRVGLWGLGFTILMGGLRLFGASGPTTTLMLLLSLSGLATLLAGSAASVMAARELFWPRVVSDLVGALLRVGAAFAAVRLGLGVIGIGYAVLAASVVAGGLCMVYAFLRFRLRWVRPDLGQLAGCFRNAIPFGLAGILFALYFRLPLILLPGLRSAGEAGLYGAAFKGIEAWVFIPGSILGAAYPILTRIRDPRDRDFSISVHFLGRLILGVSLPIAAFAGFEAPRVIALIYGNEYGAAAVALAVLSPLFPLIGLNYVLGNALYAAGRPKSVLKAEFVGLLTAAIGGVLMIPRWGVVGAAASATLMEVVVVGCNARSVSKGVHSLSWRELLIPSLPAALLSAAPFTLVSLPVFVEAPLAIALYASLLVLLGGIRKEDRIWLSENLPPGSFRTWLTRLGLFSQQATADALEGADVGSGARAA